MDNCDIITKAEEIKSILYLQRTYILDILQQCETRRTAEVELKKSIYCLENIGKIIDYLTKKKMSTLTTFLPINLPLYSLLLFVIIPGFRFQKVYYRPALLTKAIYEQLSEILGLNKYGFFCKSISRRNFINNYVLQSKTVIYTGKYDNAMDLLQDLPQDLVFIFQGSGTNPIVITAEAVISEELIDKLLFSQLFNSGQDCMAPSVIFVESSKWTTVLTRLVNKCSKINIGDYKQPETEVSRVVDPEILDVAYERITSGNATVLYGGYIDYNSQIVMPTILSYCSVDSLPNESSFSPIFSMYRYSNESEIIQYLRRPECKTNRAYISVFGKMKLSLDDEIVIMNDILDSIDDGLSEFGGYGEGSGFISFRNHTVSKPILIVKELAVFEEVDRNIVFMDRTTCVT